MKCDTKQQILNAANELFANKGYYGASVRDISNLANVNLAAINYHFSNKRELLHEVIKMGHLHLGEEIASIANIKTISFESFVEEFFLILLKNKKIILSSMKVILTEGFEDFSGEDKLWGTEIIFDILSKEVSHDVEEESLKWAVTTILSIMFHKALFINYSCKKQSVENKILVESKSVRDIKRLAKLLIDDLLTS